MSLGAVLSVVVVISAVRAQPGFIFTVAGNGVPAYFGDGGLATQASINVPYGVALDRSGNIFIADYLNARVRKINSAGIIQTVAGCGPVTSTCAFETNFGEGGLATAVAISSPWSVTADAAGNIYFPDNSVNRIRRVTPSGIITTYAGSGSVGTAGFSGDGGLAVNAVLNNPGGLTTDAGGNLYFADRGNHRIRKIDPLGIITTVAGNGSPGYNGDNIPAITASLWQPQGVGVDALGNLYIADTTNNRVRKVTPEGVITTVAGNGQVTVPTINPTGDGGLATSATMVPWDVKVDAVGNLYISDWQGQRIRKVDAFTNIIRTIAGTGAQGYSGDGSAAINALINLPTELALDALGTLYFADNGNNRIRKITPALLGPPVIRLTKPVMPSFMGQAGLSSNTYAEIYGQDFTDSERVWTARDFSGPNAPTSLNDVSVTVNGKPAYIYYVSPMQININMPDDTETGPVALQVKTPVATSNTVMVNRTRVSPTLHTVPAFNILGTQYVVAFTSDFSHYIGNPNTLSGLSFVKARPSDTVTMYALGLGPTDPPTSAGVIASQNSNMTLPLDLRIGGVPANVVFAGLIRDSIGLYQLNVVIPNVPPGDRKIELSVDGVPNGQNLYIVVGP